MILDRLDDFAQYAAAHRGFASALAFLHRPDLAELPDGRHEIDGDRAYAIVTRGEGKGHADVRLEGHRRYIDLQYVVAGCAEMGYKPSADCTPAASGFNEAEDLGFFTDLPTRWLAVPAGHLAAFFPSDAHAPLGGRGAIHRIIVKVAV